MIATFIRKNQNIAKKHSVVIIVLTNCEKKWFSCNLKFFQVTLVEKRASRKHSEVSASPRLQKPFSWCPFFNLGNLEKTSNYTWTIFSHSLSEQLWQQNTISIFVIDSDFEMSTWKWQILDFQTWYDLSQVNWKFWHPTFDKKIFSRKSQFLI